MSLEIPNGRSGDGLFMSHPDILNLDNFDQYSLHDRLASAQVLGKLSEIPECAQLHIDERTEMGTIARQRFIKLPTQIQGTRPEWLWLSDDPAADGRLVLIIGASLPGLEEIVPNVIKHDTGLSLFEFTKVDGENPDEAQYGGERLPPISYLKRDHRAQLVKEGFIGTDIEGDYWRQFVAYRRLGNVQHASWTPDF